MHAHAYRLSRQKKSDRAQPQHQLQLQQAAPLSNLPSLSLFTSTTITATFIILDSRCSNPSTCSISSKKLVLPANASASHSITIAAPLLARLRYQLVSDLCAQTTIASSLWIPCTAPT